MGLDVTAYKGLTEVDCVFSADGEPIDPNTREEVDYDFRAYLNSDFPGREGQIKHGAVYSASESMRGWSGGYGRYNAWREQLARIAGYPETDFEQYGRTTKRFDAGAWSADGGPFWELINFSDCEGVIGAEASAKLAADFAQFQSAADKEDEYFRGKYAEWRKCFEMASHNGAVDFH